MKCVHSDFCLVWNWICVCIFSLVFSEELKAVYTLTCKLVFRRNWSCVATCKLVFRRNWSCVATCKLVFRRNWSGVATCKLVFRRKWNCLRGQKLSVCTWRLMFCKEIMLYSCKQFQFLLNTSLDVYTAAASCGSSLNTSVHVHRFSVHVHIFSSSWTQIYTRMCLLNLQVCVKCTSAHAWRVMIS